MQQQNESRPARSPEVPRVPAHLMVQIFRTDVLFNYIITSHPEVISLYNFLQPSFNIRSPNTNSAGSFTIQLSAS